MVVDMINVRLFMNGRKVQFDTIKELVCDQLAVFCEISIFPTEHTFIEIDHLMMVEEGLNLNTNPNPFNVTWLHNSSLCFMQHILMLNQGKMFTLPTKLISGLCDRTNEGIDKFKELLDNYDPYKDISIILILPPILVTPSVWSSIRITILTAIEQWLISKNINTDQKEYPNQSVCLL